MPRIFPPPAAFAEAAGTHVGVSGRVTVEIEGAGKPACVAETVVRVHA